MPQRQNLKPALADTLRALRNDVQSGATVPHGVKTVQPGEGLQLLSPEGAEIFWDWATANSVEQRIQDGTALIDQTRATLAQTEQELQSAQDRIGRVAAGEIEKIDGHIIINGTVDLPALNVTGELSTAIVKALDVEARRGIFTEGLTAQDSTLLGTTVAEVINAGTVATRIMTSGLLQTTTDTNRGVKIDNTGIRAWDENGSQTVNLNGKDNYITGTFATAEKEQRVEIKSGGSIAAADFYGSGQTTDHLGVWHQADRGADTVSKIISFNQVAQHANSPGVLMYPFRGEVALAGRWARESDTLKMFFVQSFNGMDEGNWMDLVYTYATPFTTLYSLRFPVLSVETSSGRECTVGIIEQTEKYIKMRVVNKSAGPTGKLIVRGIVFNANSQIYGRYW
ncbi:hypothetical protein AABM36_08280 [Kocuria sp. KSNUG]|uniref:hypothetical protein n=1 Tax=Kocuria sp. KSNUG TaxID=3136676 RepID=UPI003C2E9062